MQDLRHDEPGHDAALADKKVVIVDSTCAAALSPNRWVSANRNGVCHISGTIANLNDTSSRAACTRISTSFAGLQSPKCPADEFSADLRKRYDYVVIDSVPPWPPTR